MIVLIPEPILNITQEPFGIKELIQYWVDNSEPFQRPISRVRLGIKVLEALDAKPLVVGEELKLPKDAIDIFRELAENAVAPTWFSKVTGQPINVPSRRLVSLFAAFLPQDG